MKSPWAKPLIYLLNFISDGHLGVNIFFVISGFLITHLLLQEEQHNGKIKILHFFIRRTLRIFPAYFFLLLVYAILQLCKIIDIPPDSWMTAIFYLKYFNWQNDWYTGHAWSLSVEEQFYLCWPFIFACNQRVRRFVPLILIILVPFIRLYASHFPNSSLNELTLFFRIDAIAWGCVLALYKDYLLRLNQQIMKFVFFLSILLLLFFQSLVSITQAFHVDWIWQFLGKSSGSLANIAIVGILFWVVFRSNTKHRYLLDNKILSTIGIYSYSIYLWQQLFTSAELFDFPINIALLGVSAFLSFQLIEKPFLRLKKKYT